MKIEQDAEYLEAVRGLIAAVIDDDEGDPDVVALEIMEDVKKAGLVLVTEADFEAMTDAYIMQAIR